MTKLESIEDIRKILMEFSLLKSKLSDDQKVLCAFQKSYEKLLERFYQENLEMIAYVEYKKARKDFDYFVQLVESVHCYFADAEQRGADEPLH